MQELEKILEEIEIKIAGSMGKKREGLLEAQDIIRKHMNDGWFSVEEQLPPEDDEEYCVRYQVMTKYGVTEGWYRPNENVWYILLWRYLSENGEINFKKGDIPTIELINPKIDTDIVIAWRSLPEPYRPERSVGE